MKLDFPSNLRCHSYISSTPKTQKRMDETQLPFELKVSFIHLLHPDNSFEMSDIPELRHLWRIITYIISNE